MNKATEKAATLMEQARAEHRELEAQRERLLHERQQDLAAIDLYWKMPLHKREVAGVVDQIVDQLASEARGRINWQSIFSHYLFPNGVRRPSPAGYESPSQATRQPATGPLNLADIDCAFSTAGGGSLDRFVGFPVGSLIGGTWRDGQPDALKLTTAHVVALFCGDAVKAHLARQFEWLIDNAGPTRYPEGCYPAGASAEDRAMTIEQRRGEIERLQGELTRIDARLIEIDRAIVALPEVDPPVGTDGSFSARRMAGMRLGLELGTY